MTRSTPSFNEVPQPVSRIAYYSDNSYLSELEWFALRLAVTTSRSSAEPKSVSEARKRIELAKVALDHLRFNGFSPIFDSFEFEALTLEGVK